MVLFIKAQTSTSFLFLNFLKVYLFILEREIERAGTELMRLHGEGQREKERETQANFSSSLEPDSGLSPTTPTP